MPLASLPVEIAGRNRYFRRMVIDGITKDPDWLNGEYKTQPIRGLTAALYSLIFMQSAPLANQKQMPTKEAADAAFDQRIKQGLATTDANDMLYQFDSSRDYNPEPDLGKITTHLLAVNSADDAVNPPELGIMDQQIKRVKHGRYVLIPISDQTRGHGTHTIANVWKQYLAELLAESESASR
jgi:homoserine O-acetyltransferase